MLCFSEEGTARQNKRLSCQIYTLTGLLYHSKLSYPELFYYLLCLINFVIQPRRHFCIVFLYLMHDTTYELVDVISLFHE